MQEESNSSEHSEDLPDNEPDTSVEPPTYEDIEKGFGGWGDDEDQSDNED